MCRANEAILKERESHPIPTVEEILQSLNGSRAFSKLDLKWGYHKLELTPDLREITALVTHCGLFRYETVVHILKITERSVPGTEETGVF